jgi:hypothetical protein
MVSTTASSPNGLHPPHPHNNGVNITIVNPRTHQTGQGLPTGNTPTLIPNQPDTFTSTSTSPPANTVSMVQPGIQITTNNGTQQVSPIPTANTPATVLTQNPQVPLVQAYQQLDKQYQELHQAEQAYRNAQQQYEALGNSGGNVSNTQATSAVPPIPTTTVAPPVAPIAGTGNPFIFPVIAGSDGQLHIQNPPNSGFPPGYSPYDNFGAIAPLPLTGNPITPNSVYTNKPLAAIPPSVMAPAPQLFESSNPPPVGYTQPNTTLGVFSSVAPKTPQPIVPPQPALVPASPPPQQVIITPTMAVPATIPLSVPSSVTLPQLTAPIMPTVPNPQPMAVDAPASPYPSQTVVLPPTAEQQVLDNQLAEILRNNTPTQPASEGDFLPPPLPSAPASTIMPSAGFVPSVADVPASLPLAEQQPTVTPAQSQSFTPEAFTAQQSTLNNPIGGSENMMVSSLPTNAYPTAYPQAQRPVAPQPQQPTAGGVVPSPVQQQQSFNATQVTPQDVAFFQAVLKMNPETAQVATALPPQQIAQLLSGDKELLGTVRQIEGMLPPGTPPSALAALMPPPPIGGSGSGQPSRPLMPPAQQPVPQTQASYVPQQPHN